MDTVTKSRERAAPWNKGKLLAPETSTEAEGHLGYPHSTTALPSRSRARSPQPRHR